MIKYLFLDELGLNSSKSVGLLKSSFGNDSSAKRLLPKLAVAPSARAKSLDRGAASYRVLFRKIEWTHQTPEVEKNDVALQIGTCTLEK